MIISHDLKLIFIHVHRTGGTAFSNVLKQRLVKNFEILPQHENFRTLNPEYINQFSEYYIFGFSRNPWERILSWYSLIHFNNQLSLEEERIRFEHFLETDAASNFSTQYFHYNSLDYFTNREGMFLANKVCQFKFIHTEVKNLCHQFNLEMNSFPIQNNTLAKNYQDFYTEKSKNLIEQKCSKDIEYFNYRF